ncbi:MAG TPA: hypothetical protein VH592_23740 [Gemmataceae bacterium]|jgi:hypothetical protein
MSARIIHFPRSARRRPPVYSASRPPSRSNSGGFTLLLFLTMPAAFLYLCGALHIARHDSLYAALMAMVWGAYFNSDKLLNTRLGPLLRLAGQCLVLGACVSFFGFVFWLVLSHP